MDEMEATAKKYVRECQRTIWDQLGEEIRTELNEAAQLIEQLAKDASAEDKLLAVVAELRECADPGRKDVFTAIRKALRLTVKENSTNRQVLINWLNDEQAKNAARFNSKLFTDTQI